MSYINIHYDRLFYKLFFRNANNWAYMVIIYSFNHYTIFSIPVMINFKSKIDSESLSNTNIIGNMSDIRDPLNGIAVTAGCVIMFSPLWQDDHFTSDNFKWHLRYNC